MKIGILTYHSSDNYGSVLQAYALQKYINKYCACEIIDYRKKEVKQLYKILKPLNSKFNFVTNLYSLLYFNALIERKKSFETFRSSEINLSDELYEDRRLIESNINDYDVLICGSDQVWNYDIVDFDTYFFLDFENFKGKRISYAASIGPKHKSLDSIKKYEHLLNKFDKITVREHNAQILVEKVINIKPDIVVDPVFLLDKNEWNSLADKSTVNTKKDYIFCYFPGGVSPSMEKYSLALANKLKCNRILIMDEWRNIMRKGKKYYKCSPYDFLKLIRDAKCVCTTSFHGTAFSLIFGTKFYVESGNNADDSRIINILSSAGKLENLINNSGLHSNSDDLDNLIQHSKHILNEVISYE